MFRSQLKSGHRFDRRPLMLLMMMCVVCCAFIVAGAQKKALDKEAKALERTADSVKILETIMASSDRAIAGNLLSKAKAVAVFPRLTKKTVLIDQFINGQGLVSRRTESGWGIPVFLNFEGVDLGIGLWGSEKSDVMVLFMTDESAQWLMKDRLQLKLKSNMMFREGVVSKPVGKMSDEELAKSGIKVIIYKITKDGFASMEALSMELSADNNLNRGVYWTKGREILAGQDKEARQHAPAGVLEFPRALARYAVEQ